MMNINTGIKLLILLCFQEVQGQLIPQKAPELEANPLKFIEKCYRRCIADKKTVLFASSNTSHINIPDFVNRNAIIILNRNYQNVKKQTVPNIASKKKVDIYIFDVNVIYPVYVLRNMINNDADGWNINAHFIVIFSEKHCSYFPSVIFFDLRMLVLNNDLSMYMICEKIIYTFNPYGDWAPAVWKPYHDRMYYISNTSFFYFNFTEDEYECQDLFFDRLDKIETPVELKFVMEISEEEECNLVVSPKKSVMLNYTIRIILLLSKLMKIPFEKYLKCVNEKSFIDVSGKGRGPAIEGIANREYNVLLNPQPMRDTKDTLVSATTGKMNIAIIMHHRRKLPIFQRILQYFGVGGFLTCLIFGVISTIVLKCCLKASFMWSAIQSVALLLIATSNIRSKRNSLRIFIFVLSLSGFVLNTTFGNEVLSIIYGGKYNDVKTVKEFEAIASQYRLYCPPGMDMYVNEYLNQLCFPIIEHSCEIILNDPGAACVYYKRSSYEMVVKNDLHMVPEMLAEAFMSYKMKTDWKLHEHFNRACTRMFESHIPRVLINQYIYRFHRELEISKFNSQDRPRALVIKDLMFAFLVLYIGLAIAFISFLWEIKLLNFIADLISKL